MQGRCPRASKPCSVATIPSCLRGPICSSRAPASRKTPRSCAPHARPASPCGPRWSSRTACSRSAIRSSASPEPTARPLTTLLTAAMLERGGVPSAAAGNVGTALSSFAGRRSSRAARSCASSRASSSRASSSFRSDVAVLLNVTPDHLDRHGTFEAYAAAKLRVFERQREQDVAVLCIDDAYVAALSDDDAAGGRAPGARLGRRPRAVRGGLRGLAAARPAQPREHGLRDRRGPGARCRRGRRRRCPARLRRARAPARGDSRAARRALRQRLQGDERRGDAAGARLVRRPAARDPRRLAQGRRLRARSPRRSRAAPAPST